MYLQEYEEAAVLALVRVQVEVSRGEQVKRRGVWGVRR